jgi:transcription regulator MmyB-like protein
VISLVGDLSIGSERFRKLWARHDVKQDASGIMLLNHPEVGRLELHYQQLLLPLTGQVLAPYWAEPGSRSEEKLRLLASV